LNPASTVVGEDCSPQALDASGELVRDAGGYSDRRWLRNRIWSEEDEAHYGLQLEPGWQQAAVNAAGRPLVVLIHGYNSTPQRNAALLIPIRAAGYPCAAFAYPNDWEID